MDQITNASTLRQLEDQTGRLGNHFVTGDDVMPSAQPDEPSALLLEPEPQILPIPAFFRQELGGDDRAVGTSSGPDLGRPGPARQPLQEMIAGHREWTAVRVER
jgi:hypothetical protein